MIYFVKTSKFTDLKWGTRGPVTVECDGYGMFELRTNGSYVIEIEDAPTFIKTIVGTDGKFDVDDIERRDNTLVDVIRQPKIKEEHYTEIYLEKFYTSNWPQYKSISKIKQ